MIEFCAVSKHFAGQDILTNVSFRINPGEHAGIVGPNGAGKSTLFELLHEDIAPDRGDITLPRNVRLGYLHQQLNPHTETRTLLQYTADAIPELITLHAEIDRIEADVKQADGAERERMLKQLGELQTQFEHLGGYDIQSRAEAALSGLGFSEAAFLQPFSALSGGWQMRAEMARTLIANPDILLLDEPSNYLDLPAVEWLQRYLKAYQGTMLLISHDRYLLQNLTNVILEVSGGQVTRYPGDYAYYLRERGNRREIMEAAQKNQDRKREQIERFVERFRAKNTKATQVQSRIKQLEKMEILQAPPSAPLLARLELPPPPHSGADIMQLINVGFTYDQTRWIFRNVDLTIHKGEKTALIGFNGMGKTTLLRILAGTLAPIEGEARTGHKVVVGYQSQEFAETMPPDSSLFHIVKNAGPTISDMDARNALGRFGFSGPAIDKRVSVLSGGEKIRLAFARIFVCPPNFLILDEPTTHLDIEAREALQNALRKYQGTVCFVSHDVEFTRQTADHIIAMTPPGITRYPGGYAYYLEKTGPLTQNASAAARPSADPSDKKLQRRERAQKREELRKKSMDIKRSIRAAEEAIERLETEQKGLLDELTSNSNNCDFAGINRRLQVIQEQLEQHNTQWEMSVLALDDIEHEIQPDSPLACKK
ncbi:MAG: ABC transporter ATP-binding protein [Spartobacteria bacterium]|nr:ABC transporter ATP-binding protein [Spartobacteria bacterium]